MSVKKDPTVAFIWVAIAIVVLWRTVRIMRGEFSQKERLGGFKPTCYTQTIVKVAKQEKDMSKKQVIKDLHHQIWYFETNQEEKEIEENKNHELSQEEIDSRMKSYTKWKIKYLREFIKEQ